MANFTFLDPVEIKDAPASIIVDNDQDASFYCRLEGSPLEESHITWRSKSVPDLISRSSRSFRNNTAFLMLPGVSREDSGVVECVGDNGVGNLSVRAIQLLVKCK